MRMPRVTWVVLIAILVLGLLAVGALAENGTSNDQAAMSQASAGTTGPTPTPSPAPAPVCAVPCPPGVTNWDDCLETTITGKLVCLPALGQPTDVDFSMMVTTGDGVTHRVWLAPGLFLTSLNFGPTLNDDISIIGMPVGTCGDFIARQIVYGCNTYTVRDHCGAPQWAIAMDEGFASYASMWNPYRMYTFQGRIDRVQPVFPGGEAYGPGVAIRLARTIADDVPSWQQPPYEFTPNRIWVHLGPEAYTKQQLCDLCGCQPVIVTGSQVNWCGEPILLASCVQRGSNHAYFRSAMGEPAWANGWRGWSEATMASSISPFGTYQNICGCIEDIRAVGALGDMGNVNLLTIRTDSNCLVVVAINEQAGICFKTGDKIMASGFLAVPNSREVLVANRIDHGGQRYVLGTANGVCSWVATGPATPVSLTALSSACTMCQTAPGPVSQATVTTQ